MAEPEDPHRPPDPFSTPPAPYEQYRGPHYPAPQPGPWKALAIVFGSIVAVGALALVGIAAVGFFAFSDDVTSIRLDDAVADECSAMVDAALDVPLLAGPEAAREPLRALADAADELATTGARAAEGDADRAWAADWRRLADALGALADDPSSTFALPTRDGTPVTVTLGLDGPIDCEPPPVITALDPSAPGALYVDDADVW